MYGRWRRNPRTNFGGGRPTFTREKIPVAEIPTHFYAVSMHSPGICVILSCISEKNFVEENTEAEIIDEEREVR